MKKSVLVKLTSVFLLSMFLLSYLSVFSAGAAQLIEDLVVASKVASLRKDALLISYNSFVQSDCIVEDGLTVVYGENINIEIIEQKSEIKMMAGSSDATESKNTYMVLYMKNGATLDIEYVSVSYDNDVNPNNISQFVASQLSDTGIDNTISDFLSEQVNSTESALNRSNRDNECMASYATTSTQSNRVVERVRNTGYYIDNYEGLINDYPLVIYKKNITYEAVYVPDNLDDTDTYYIVAYVYVTPGNAISSSSYSGVYNDQYGEKIIVCGAKTQFFNLFPDDEYGDYFIDMRPMNNGISQNDVNGEEVQVSISTNGEEVSLDFCITSPDDTAVINMVTHFDPDDISYVEFLTETRSEFPFSSTYVPIADDQFYYNAYVYMSSAGNVLYTKAGTGIYYCFTNDDTSLRFAGSAQEIYYEAD